MILQFGSVFFLNQHWWINYVFLQTRPLSVFLSVVGQPVKGFWGFFGKNNLQVVSFVFVTHWPHQCHVSTLRAGGAACLWSLTWLFCLQLPPFWLHSQCAQTAFRLQTQFVLYGCTGKDKKNYFLFDATLGYKKILSLKLSQNDYAAEASLTYTSLSVVLVAFWNKLDTTSLQIKKKKKNALWLIRCMLSNTSCLWKITFFAQTQRAYIPATFL